MVPLDHIQKLLLWSSSCGWLSQGTQLSRTTCRTWDLQMFAQLKKMYPENALKSRLLPQHLLEKLRNYYLEKLRDSYKHCSKNTTHGATKAIWLVPCCCCSPSTATSTAGASIICSTGWIIWSAGRIVWSAGRIVWLAGGITSSSAAEGGGFRHRGNCGIWDLSVAQGRVVDQRPVLEVEGNTRFLKRAARRRGWRSSSD